MERVFLNRISELAGVRRILHENDLKKLYGWDAASVDFLLEFDDGVVMIQCKFRNTRRREDLGINNFIKSIEYISDQMKRPLLFGLWVSRLEPFDDNKEMLRRYNVRPVSVFGTVEQLCTRAYNDLVQMCSNK